MKSDDLKAEPVVTVFGDSISAGYGLSPGEDLPTQLRAALADLDVPAQVIGAGIDGDTTADGLARLQASVPLATDLCVVALGANDMMQALPPQSIMDALDAIVTALRARRTDVLLCGMKAPPWFSTYRPGFDAVFPTIAARHGIPLYPFLLEGVALDPRFNQADRIHPNAAGIAIIAGRLAPVVRDALAARSARPA